MTNTITTVGVFLTEDERSHLINLCDDLEARSEAARLTDGLEAATRAAEHAALRKLMGLPAANAASDHRMLAQIIRAPSAGWRGMTGIRVIVDGEVIGTGDYGGEPEDNCEYRDYKWVKELLVTLAKKLGASASIENVEVDGPTSRAACEAYYAAMAAKPTETSETGKLTGIDDKETP